MNKHHVHHQLGTGWFMVPTLGAIVALVLLAAWPSVFNEAAARPSVAAPAAAYVSSDPSLPAASAAFEGRNVEVAQQVDTF